MGGDRDKHTTVQSQQCGTSEPRAITEPKVIKRIGRRGDQAELSR